MTQELMDELDVEEIKQFPFLWEGYQRYMQRTRTEAQIETIRDNILEAIAIRLSPSATAYRRLERITLAMNDLGRLNDLFRFSQRAADFAEFERGLAGDSVNDRRN